MGGAFPTAKRTAHLSRADDYVDSDGSKILSFREAQETAGRWFADIGQNDYPSSKRYSVSDAVDDYLESFGEKALKILVAGLRK
jgi:hypothetical protein